MSLGARLETKMNTGDGNCGFGNTRTSLRFLMTAFKGLSSSGVFRLPGVGATIEVSRMVMALIMRPCGNAIWNGVGGSGRVCAAADRVCPLPGCGGREVSTLSGGVRIPSHVSVNKHTTRTSVVALVSATGMVCRNKYTGRYLYKANPST